MDFKELKGERPDPVQEAELAGEVFADSMRRARDAVIGWNEWERANAKEPERIMRYTVTLDCTFSVWSEIRGFIERYPIRKWYRQEELPEGGRQGG